MLFSDYAVKSWQSGFVCEWLCRGLASLQLRAVTLTCDLQTLQIVLVPLGTSNGWMGQVTTALSSPSNQQGCFEFMLCICFVVNT